MSIVKGRVRLVGDRGQYANVDDMSFPNPHCDRMQDLEWQLRHGSEIPDRSDLLYAASIISAYRELILGKTNKDRQYVCSAIKWTGSVTDFKVGS